MQRIEEAYASCHPRTIWYMKEIAHCLVAYYGLSPEEAIDHVVRSPELRKEIGSNDEPLLWHDLPIDLAYHSAVSSRPNIQRVSNDIARAYQLGRFDNPPPEAIVRKK